MWWRMLGGASFAWASQPCDTRMTHPASVAIGLAELPTRDGSIARGVIAAAQAAGLELSHVFAEHAKDGSVVSILREALAQHDVDAEVDPVTMMRVEPDALPAV